MRFLVDEDVPIEVARCLRQDGHEIPLVVEHLAEGADDATVWQQAAAAESRLKPIGSGRRSHPT